MTTYIVLALPPTSYVTLSKPRQLSKPQYHHLKKKTSELHFLGQSPRVAFNRNVDAKTFSL